MRLVYKTDDINEAYSLCDLLTENGIPAIVEENILRNRARHIPKGNEIWIYLNSQYRDAVELIDNPNHEVSNPVSLDEFAKFRRNNKSAALVALYRSVIKYGVIFSGIVIIVLLVLFKFNT